MFDVIGLQTNPISFPGMCLLKVCYLQEDKLARWKIHILKAMAMMFIVVGAFVFGVTTTQAITNDVISASTPRVVRNETLCT
jgi:hypothetical protein